MSNDIVHLLGRARSGDEHAYQELFRRLEQSLCGVLRYRGGYGAEQAAQWAREVWIKRRALILRPPETGGYTPADGTFYRWVVNHCTDWGQVKSEDYVPSCEVSWPHNESGEPIDVADPNQPGADRIACARRRFALLLEIVFLPETGYPHQQLCFVLSKYVHGQMSPRGIDGNPSLVAREYATATLDGMAEAIFDDCLATDADGDSVDASRLRWITRLRERLALPVGKIMARDGHSLGLYRALVDRKAGDTRLQDYLDQSPGGAEAAISVWSTRVSRTVRGLLGLALIKGDDPFWTTAERLVAEK